MLLARYGCTVMARRRKGPWMSSCDKTIMFTFNWIEVQQQQHQHLTVDQRWVERKKRVLNFQWVFYSSFYGHGGAMRSMDGRNSLGTERKRETIKVVLCLQNSLVCALARGVPIYAPKSTSNRVSAYIFLWSFTWCWYVCDVSFALR